MAYLVVGVKNAIGLSTLASLKHCSEDIVAVDTLRVAPGLYYDEVASAHHVDNYNFETINSIAEKHKIDVVFISERQLAYSLSTKAGQMSMSGARVALPEKEIVSTVLDKRKVCEEFPDITPNIYSPSEKLSYPVVLRDKLQRIEGGIDIIQNRDQFEQEYRQFQREKEDPVIQEYIEGDEYIVSVLCNNDTIVYCTALAVHRKSWDFLGNISEVVTVSDNRLLRKAKGVVNQLGISDGHLKMLFKKPQEGPFKLISVSPLLNELQSAATSSGHNHARTLGRIIGGKPVDESRGYEKGIHAVKNTVYRTVSKEEVL